MYKTPNNFYLQSVDTKSLYQILGIHPNFGMLEFIVTALGLEFGHPMDPFVSQFEHLKWKSTVRLFIHRTRVGIGLSVWMVYQAHARDYLIRCSGCLQRNLGILMPYLHVPTFGLRIQMPFGCSQVRPEKIWAPQSGLKATLLSEWASKGIQRMQWTIRNYFVHPNSCLGHLIEMAWNLVFWVYKL